MFRKRHPPVGSMPGTLVMPTGAVPPRVHVMKYRAEALQEHDIAGGVAELAPLLDGDGVCWIDVQGLGDEKLLRELAADFHMHPLALEDVVNIPQRPKVENFDAHTLCITRMVVPRGDGFEPEQVSIFIGRNFVLTFQEQYGDVFDAVRQRIRQGGPVLRSSGPSYLAYAILDAAIDSYYPRLEQLGERLESLQDEILEQPSPRQLEHVHAAKTSLMAIRRTMWPQREMISTLIRDENALIGETARLHLRDCYDHCVQLMDVVESYREVAGGLMDVYLSSMGNRQNEVMKVLTIMASIFIPMTFLAGIYGMNFQNMPELHAKWGYPLVLLAMAATAIGMLTFFYRKGWLGGRRS